MKYYVLGRKDNPMLKEYLNKFYDKLLEMFLALSQKGILIEEIDALLKVENREFIMNADQSSIVNLLYIELIKFWKDKKFYKNYIDKLRKEIDLFLAWKNDELIMNKWSKIYWTNIKLTIEDNNPFNEHEAHPDHQATGGIMWWWEKTEEDWLLVYEKTFELLKNLDEWIYDELNQIITKIVPLWTAKWLHNSASYKESVWHLYMWYTIDSGRPEVNNLEAIIHESSHNKLNLLLQFDPIVLNDREEKYYSAIRPDARHIHGVFLWVHAFAPTMYMLMKAYRQWFLWDDQNWLEKIVLYYIKTKFLYKVIAKYAKFTTLWKEIWDEVVYVISLMDKLFKEINPSNELIVRAKERQQEHFKQVNRNYSNLEY